MRWIDARRYLPLLAAVSPIATDAALADVMILRAVGPSSAHYVAGRTIPDATRIALRANDQLVLLDSHGTRTLQGPGIFVAGAASSAATSLISLAGASSQRRARIGAVRNNLADSGPPRRPNIWFVDIGQNGPACLTDAKTVTIWRRDSEIAGSSAIVAPGGATAKIDWIKGQATQSWPAKLPIVPNGDYRVTGAGASPAGNAIRFQMIGQPPVDMQTLGAALVSHACQGQIDVLIATTAKQG